MWLYNTITDGGSTAPLYCWYHTEEKTIQEHKGDWKDVRGIVGRRWSGAKRRPSRLRREGCYIFFLLKLGTNWHRLPPTATNCHILIKRADEELMKSWWRADEELMKRWWRADEELMKNWWRNDEDLMKNWWRTDEELIKNWWRTVAELKMNWWST